MAGKLIYCLAPFGILLLSIALACLFGFMLLMGLGDVLTIERIVNKGTQLFLVLSIFPLLSLLKLKWEDLGFNGKQLFSQQLWQGFVTGIIILGPIIVVLYLLHIRELDETKIWTTTMLMKTLLGSLVTALLISLIEEPLFRGLLLTAMHRKMGLTAGVFISSFYYAGLHFLKTDLDVPYAELQWFSALELVLDAFHNLFSGQNIASFFALLMVGIFLGVARLKAGLGLGFCVGCHAGWVFLIKLTKSMSTVNVNADYFFLVSHYDGVIGPLVTLWLILAVMSYLLYSGNITVKFWR